MICLKKKSLFFMILAIACNPTFSDRNAECKTNIHQVFNEDMEPYFAFHFAMFSLSEKVIEIMTTEAESESDSEDDENELSQPMTTGAESEINENVYRQHRMTRAELANHFENPEHAILYPKHEVDLIYFRSLVAGIATHIDNTTSSNTNNDIIRYFRYLVSKFDQIPQCFEKYAMSPQKFCSTFYKIGKTMCKRALGLMLKVSVASVETMGADEAFMCCYLNYTHLDFTIEKSVMLRYFSHMMDVANKIISKRKKLDPNLFPSVAEYCSSLGRSSN